MALADGNTCSDCVHVLRCCLIFGQLPEDESCQFFPVRFYPKPIIATTTSSVSSEGPRRDNIKSILLKGR